MRAHAGEAMTILDTNVVSELMLPIPSPAVLSWVSAQPLDAFHATAFSCIAAGRRAQGRPMAEFDAQISAIAYVHGAVLATRHTTDFEGCGIRLANPWVD